MMNEISVSETGVRTSKMLIINEQSNLLYFVTLCYLLWYTLGRPGRHSTADEQRIENWEVLPFCACRLSVCGRFIDRSAKRNLVFFPSVFSAHRKLLTDSLRVAAAAAAAATLSHRHRCWLFVCFVFWRELFFVTSRMALSPSTWLHWVVQKNSRFSVVAIGAAAIFKRYSQRYTPRRRGYTKITGWSPLRIDGLTYLAVWHSLAPKCHQSGADLLRALPTLGAFLTFFLRVAKIVANACPWSRCPGWRSATDSQYSYNGG